MVVVPITTPVTKMGSGHWAVPVGLDSRGAAGASFFSWLHFGRQSVEKEAQMR